MPGFPPTAGWYRSPTLRPVSGLRTAASRAVKEAAALGDRVRAPEPGGVVLVYHRVGGGSASDTDLPRSRFEEQMAWLAGRGVATTIDDALGALGALDEPATAERPDADRVVVTFDDGTADLIDVALPILVR